MQSIQIIKANTTTWHTVQKPCTHRIQGIHIVVCTYNTVNLPIKSNTNTYTYTYVQYTRSDMSFISFGTGTGNLPSASRISRLSRQIEASTWYHHTSITLGRARTTDCLQAGQMGGVSLAEYRRIGLQLLADLERKLK